MSDVLTDDQETTPITPAAEGLYCDLCEHDPFKSAGGLAGHRATVHGIKGRASRGPSAAKPPPAAGTARPAAKPLAKRLEGSFGLIGIGVSFVEPYDGRCITSGAADLGVSLAQLAAAYPETRKYLEMLCLDSPALAVVLATMPVLLPIMKHHGIIRINLPAPFAGPPEGKAAPAPAAGEEPAPASAPTVDLSAMMGAIGPILDAAKQATAAAPRPMGDGAPSAAESPPAAPPAAPEGSSEDGAPLPFEGGEQT